jgi:hypothetical protein
MKFVIVEALSTTDAAVLDIACTNYGTPRALATVGLRTDGDVAVVMGPVVDEMDLDQIRFELHKWAVEQKLKATCWEPVITYDETCIELERAIWRAIVERNATYPLVKAIDVIRDVDAYTALFPDDFTVPGIRADFDDVINETGCADVDHYSVLNMLSHFYSTPQIDKCEWMTVVAYKYELDIHPLAFALTPKVAATIRAHHNGA